VKLIVRELHFRRNQHLHVLFLHLLAVLHPADQFLHQVDAILVLVVQTRRQGPGRQDVVREGDGGEADLLHGVVRALHV